jgi:opacity protein-like surface antigen
MKRLMKAGLAAAALAAGALTAGSAGAADLGHYRGGSIKDGYQPMPVLSSPTCYFKAMAGYSWSRDPSVRWTGTSFANVSFGDSWLGEAGLGCGSAGDRGLRGELAFGARGEKKFDADITNVFIPPGDPAHTSVQSYTMMFNAYYDFGNHGGFVPYVGAGVGFAYNRMSNVYFTGPVAFANQVIGHDVLSAAWAVMTGVEYKVSSRASIDLGYRYIDFGKTYSDHGDSANFWNPRFRLDDLAAHELTLGVRYKFCGPTC